MRKAKKRVGKMDRRMWVFWTIVVFLIFVLSFLYIQNVILKEKVKELERDDEIKVGEGVDDFVGSIIEKVNGCFPVQIFSKNSSAIIVATHC